MNYIIFKADGSVLTQNLEYYIQQGNSGDEIFVGFIGGLATDVAIAVFTLPNETTNTVAGVFEQKDIEVEGVTTTYNGWTFALTLDQTTYNGLLRMSIRINRNNQVIVSYPLALVVNETGVMPDTDSGVTIQELNSYLVQLQQTFSGIIRRYDFLPTNTLGDIFNEIGLDIPFVMSFDGEISACYLSEDVNGYFLNVNNGEGQFISSSTTLTTQLQNLTYFTLSSSKNIITGLLANGTFTAQQLSQIALPNCILVYNGHYYYKDNTVSNLVYFRMFYYSGSDFIHGYIQVDTTTGDYGCLESFIDYRNNLAYKEDKLNKVTSISNTSTDTQYPSAKCVYDKLVEMKEIVEGKASVYCLSYSESLNALNYADYHYFDNDGNIVAFSSQQELLDYLNGYTCVNSIFNSQAATVVNNTSSTYLIIRSLYDQSLTEYVILRKTFGTGGYDKASVKLGDVFFVYETVDSNGDTLPDRWLGQGPQSPSGAVFYKMETAKIDLTNYVDLSSAQTISGQKTFAVSTFYANGANILPENDAQVNIGASTKRINIIYTTEVRNDYGSLPIRANGDVSISTSATGGLRPDADNRSNLGSSSYTWKDLYLSGTAYLGSGTNQTIYGDAYNRLVVGNSATFSTSAITPSQGNDATDLGSSTSAWKNAYIYRNLSNGIYSYTIAESYGKLFNSITQQATILSYSSLCITNISADTTFSLAAAPTNCYPEYKAIITNTSGSSVNLTFNGVTKFLCNDDNITISTNVITLPANTTIEVNICNGKGIAVNFEVA